MNHQWNIRLLTGPLRPFLMRKVIDALRERILAVSLRALPTSADVDRTIAQGVAPFPSSTWMQRHAEDVRDFASSMRDGRPAVPGIDAWSVDSRDPDNVDVRCIHELSRMHHWCAYALVAHIDAEHAHAWCDLLAAEITAFAATWPAERGTHWAFPMGTALRAYSMLAALDWARRTGWGNPEVERRVAAMAIDHATSVWVRRERRGGLSTSHYAANLLGVLAVARYIPDAPQSPTWEAFAARELCSELRRHILDDGMTDEASTGYHRQIVDIFVHARALLGQRTERYGWTSNDNERLDRAVARCAALERIGMPLIGDNDDGMAMKLTGFQADCSYLYDLVPPAIPVLDSMPDFGLYVLGDDSLRVTLRNGPVGQFGKGGHAHQDQNAMTVSADGMALIVDPGSSVYTHDATLRNHERSVGMHATMWWNDVDQLDAPPGEEGLFWLLADKVRCSVSVESPRTITGCVVHQQGRSHTRTLTCDGDNISVHDECHGGSSDVCAWFPLHPDVTVTDVGENRVRLERAGVACDLAWNAGTLIRDTIHVAPAFGHRVASQRLAIHGNAELRWSLHRRA